MSEPLLDDCWFPEIDNDLQHPIAASSDGPDGWGTLSLLDFGEQIDDATVDVTYNNKESNQMLPNLNIETCFEVHRYKQNPRLCS